MDIGPSREPRTLEETRRDVKMLIDKLHDEPGIEWVALVYELLENTTCTCQPPSLDKPAQVITADFRRSQP